MPGKKRLFLFVCFYFILEIFLFPLTAAAVKEPDTTAEAVVLMDAGNGQVLYQKNMSRHMFPASTTKILTADVALEKGNLSDKVTVAREACLVDGSRIGLQEGEKLTLEDLLYALMMASANDAAESIAIHLSGSIEDFGDLMNVKAKSVGALDSNFNNPHGLTDPKHYTTAYDLALITRYAMQNPVFREIVGTRIKKISRPDADRSIGPPQEDLWNHNRLLSRYQGATGVKTGYTNESGQCLAAAAEKDGRELIAVLLNNQASTLYEDAGVLLDYGFDNFVSDLVVRDMEKVITIGVSRGVSKVDVYTGSSFYYNFQKGQKEQIKRSVELYNGIKAPLAAGQEVGHLVLTSGGQEVGKVKLFVKDPVKSLPEKSVIILIAGLLLTFAAREVYCVAKRRKRRLSRRYRN
ncbi:MAG TPA: D-alanyl-D-alanine carboxypeptidase [Desulfotomaculum sp.]|nr:MAG: Serine-type D-Ala-D-Ala carboxypeptidase [Desulfotomaculum sp. 46_80]HAG11952.1 D-alanyl-D-alanine carboxypeptidase [Desulfotomaculum sp.]HBY04734.1 D-alanyl-D-alanine carboxypeptidase [Desulfotomaculum sp.]